MSRLYRNLATDCALAFITSRYQHDKPYRTFDPELCLDNYYIGGQPVITYNSSTNTLQINPDYLTVQNISIQAWGNYADRNEDDAIWRCTSTLIDNIHNKNNNTEIKAIINDVQEGVFAQNSIWDQYYIDDNNWQWELQYATISIVIQITVKYGNNSPFNLYATFNIGQYALFYSVRDEWPSLRISFIVKKENNNISLEKLTFVLFTESGVSNDNHIPTFDECQSQLAIQGDLIDIPCNSITGIKEDYKNNFLYFTKDINSQDSSIGCEFENIKNPHKTNIYYAKLYENPSVTYTENGQFVRFMDLNGEYFRTSIMINGGDFQEQL